MAKNNIPIFDAKKHTYTDPEEKFLYTSVTKWVENFKPHFDELLVAKRIAERESVSVEIILEEWKRKRDDSAEFGTKIHKVLELYNSTGKIYDDKFSTVIDSFKKLNLTFDKKNTFFEKLVYDKKLKIAGTSDVIVHNSDKTFSIYDFKTNKRLQHWSPYRETLLGPLFKYPNCEYFIYALQLSMYAYLYKLMSGLEPLRLKILWFSRESPENYNNLNGNWELINVPYMEDEIIKCLKAQKA